MTSAVLVGRLSAAALASVLTLVVAGAPASVVVPGADLPPPQVRTHVDMSLGLLGAHFNVYVDAALPAEWTAVDLVSTGFATGDMAGTFETAVYASDRDGRLLFTYRITNTGSAAVRMGNVAGFDPQLIDVLDSGILDLDGDVAFDQGDVLQLSRSVAGAPQLRFTFQALDETLMLAEKLLAPGQTSSWFYAETDATTYEMGVAAVLDSGNASDEIDVLVPVPEPTGLSLLTVGIIICLRRRRNVG